VAFGLAVPALSCPVPPFKNYHQLATRNNVEMVGFETAWQNADSDMK
jgi:hypothetical protein